jgi:N-acetylneuraminic acid mutarotase
MIPARHTFLFCLALATTLASSPVQAAHVAAGAANTWTAAAPLLVGRGNAVAASADRKIFLFGGFCSTNACTTFDAYDPQSNTWTSMGNIPAFVGQPQSATTGPDGRIYLNGLPAPTPGATSPPSATMVVYDPRTNTWTRDAPPPGVSGSAQLVTGLDGRIYAVGGAIYASPVPARALSAFTLSTHRWKALAPLPAPLAAFGTAVGPDGRIYVIGGNEPGSSAQPDRVYAYDPKTDVWSAAAPLPTPRAELQAVTGRDGRIYAIGGQGRCFTSPCNVMEAYDVRTGTWSAVANIPHPRWMFAAVLGPDGRIYVLAGAKALFAPPIPLVKTVDVYTTVPANEPLPAPPRRPTPVTTELAPMPTARENLGVVTGADGTIYAIGGQLVLPPQVSTPGTAQQPPTILRTVEAYDPKTNLWSSAPPLPAPRQGMGVSRGPDGRMYVLGGIAVPGTPFPNNGYMSGLRTVFIYDPTTHRWSNGKPMPEGRYRLAAVTGQDGRIYTIGGATQCRSDLLSVKIVPRARPLRRPADLPFGGCAGTRTVRSFDPRTGVWKTLASLQTERLAPAAAVGPDGRIYVFGGDGLTGPPDPRVEIYDPRSNRWSWGPKAPHTRANAFAAATAADGRIDLIGGCFVKEIHKGGYTALCGPPSPVDAYDSHTNRWSTLGLTLNARLSLAATAGADGRVYAVGGQGDGNGKMLEVITGSGRSGRT